MRFLFVVMFISRAFSVGEAGAVFLLINPGSAAVGTGEAQVAKADDAYASYYNPAGLGFLRGQEVVLQHVNWLPNLADDIFYEFVGYRKSVKGLGTFGGHIIYLNLGEQSSTDSQGNLLGNFKSYMMAFSLSYGAQIASNKSIGINFKIYHQKLADTPTEGETGDPSSTDFAFDVGYLQKFGKDNQYRAGFSIQNIGPPIDFIDSQQADPAPTNMKVGIYAEIFNDGTNKINLLFDANKLLVASYPRMDWNGDGIISGSKEESHTDPWYEAWATAWLDDWYYGGDYDLCGTLCEDTGSSADNDLSRYDIDIANAYSNIADSRIGGYIEYPGYDYWQNDQLYDEYLALGNKVGDYAEYYDGDLLTVDGVPYATEDLDGSGYKTALDFMIENMLDKVTDSDSGIVLKTDQIVYIPNYNGFCEQQYGRQYVVDESGQVISNSNVYAEGSNLSYSQWHDYSMCYDGDGDSYYSYERIGDFGSPSWGESKNDDFEKVVYIDLPYDGMGDFDRFDHTCSDGICQNDNDGAFGNPRYDIEVTDNVEEDPDYEFDGYQINSSNFNESGLEFRNSKYGVYNPYGDYEKGSGDNRKFKDELEEMVYNFGLEWEYTESFVMRLGFIYDLEGELKNPTFGAGINFDNYGFDFGYTSGVKGHPRENTMFFSLSLGL
ncbi:PorV/PorQ family protein [Candidatus Marinimicrobia bacterium]|nr:PorV/PorQ family protein [Candidatus Neomarinimicrobiota bacterium]